VAALLAIPGRWRNHSFTMFDQTKGADNHRHVTDFVDQSPCYIEIDVPDESGAIKHWAIEMGSPSILQQAAGNSAT